MLVRFDNKKVQETVQDKSNPIGVEGDPPTKQGGLSEAEHLVLNATKKIDENGGEPLDRVPTDVIEEQKAQEPGPELNAEAVEAARKDKKPQSPAS
jgi:protein phosphatase PTC1